MSRESQKPKSERSLEDFQSTRVAVKQEIDHILKADGSKAVIKLIFSELQLSYASKDPSQLIRSYTLIMSALVHHVRYDSLKDAEINRIFDDAIQLLQMQNITPSHPKLAVLHSDLHAVKSQIELGRGRFWSSIWNHQIAAKSTRGATDRDKAYQSLGASIRAFRFGLGNLAVRELTIAEQQHQKPRERQKARLNRIKLKRLTQDWELFDSLCEELHQTPELNTDIVHELKWERMCAEFVRGQESSELFRAIQRSKTHYQASYVAEGRLLAMCEPSTRQMQKMTKLATVAADRQLGLNQCGEIYRALCAIENAYDAIIPHQTRLDGVGSALERMHLLASFEQELIVLVAATRWLSRHNELGLAEICLAEYRAKSLRLSSGTCADALNQVGDLIERDWFQVA
jgi:hypothetical protein